MRISLFWDRYIFPFEFGAKVLKEPPVEMCAQARWSQALESISIAHDILLAVNSEGDPVIVVDVRD
jgi:hypothetical protein